MDNQKSPKNPRRTGSETVLIQDAHVWNSNRIIRGSILTENGAIKKIARRITQKADQRISAGGLIAVPGLIDAHVHLRDMKLSYKEDFATGTAAAAAGGFTSVLDMPNTLPPTDAARRLREKAAVASRKILVNIGFHAAAVKSGDSVRAIKNAGAFSLKLYLPKPIAPLNVEKDQEILQVMKSAKSSGLPLSVHAEQLSRKAEGNKSTSFSDLIKTRSNDAEESAIARILRLQQHVNCRVHLCHVTLPSSIHLIHNARLPQLSSEVTPHHVLLNEESLKRLGWKAWMVPPLRRRSLSQQLLRTVASGEATIIATDHAPHTIAEKKSRPGLSPPGVPGLETAMPVLLTMVNKRRVSLGRVLSLLTTRPARLFNLRSRGRLEKSAAGDIALIDLRRRGKIEPEKFLSKAHYSPFEGWKTRGAIHTTIVNGQIVYSDGEIVAKPGTGRILKPGS